MSEDPTQLATLLVSCPDRRGLVAALAQVLAGHGANILDANQHTDPVAKQFFQRIRFDASELLTDKGTLERAIDEVAARFSMRLRFVWNDRPKRVAILVSKYEHCLVDLMLRHRSGELPCEIPVVISNHADLRASVEQFGIDFHCIPTDPENRAAADDRMLELLADRRVDLVVLARYMQILSPAFITRYEYRIINIHHSFLPAFVGGKPYHQAHARGVKIIGVTAHYATESLDEGPIIEQDVARCSHRDQVSDLIRKGKDLEKVVLARAVRWHLDDRVLVHGNKTVVFD
jgi:formyltetrahydrofolate deformylase